MWLCVIVQCSSGVNCVLLRPRMYMERQPKSLWLCTWCLAGTRPFLDGVLLWRSGRSIAQPGFSRRGGPVRNVILCRSRWHCSLGIASLDIWMVAILIRYVLGQSSLLYCQLSFVPLRIIGPAHYTSSVFTFVLVVSAFCF